MSCAFMIKEKIENPKEWYDREVEEDYGEVPEFKNWVDVASYVDKYMPL